MTLFNVDKDGEGRLTPRINAADVHLNRKAHGTDSISPRAEGATGVAHVITKDDKIIVHDGTNNRVLVGIAPDGIIDISASKTGYDITGLY